MVLCVSRITTSAFTRDMMIGKKHVNKEGAPPAALAAVAVEAGMEEDNVEAEVGRVDANGLSASPAIPKDNQRAKH